MEAYLFALLEGVVGSTPAGGPVFRDGRPPREGDLFRDPELADALDRLGAHGRRPSTPVTLPGASSSRYVPEDIRFQIVEQPTCGWYAVPTREESLRAASWNSSTNTKRLRTDLSPVIGADPLVGELQVLAARRADVMADWVRGINRLRGLLTTAVAATGEERERLWSILTAAYPFFTDHAAKTERVIPVVVVTRT